MGVCSCCAACAAACVLHIISSILITAGIIICALGGILYWGSKLILPLIQNALGNAANAADKIKTLDISHIQSMMGSWGTLAGYAGLIVFCFGLFLIAVGILGCIGACCRLKVVLIIYAIIMIAITLAFAALAAGIHFFKPEMEKQFKPHLKTLLINDYQGNTVNETDKNPFTIVFDIVQARLGCCGVDNYTDYYNATKWTKEDNRQIPKMCCKIDMATGEPKNSSCPATPTVNNSNMNTPCYSKVWNLIDQYSEYIVYGFAVAAGVVAILAVLTIIMLCHHFKNDTTPI